MSRRMKMIMRFTMKIGASGQRLKGDSQVPLVALEPATGRRADQQQQCPPL